MSWRRLLSIGYLLLIEGLDQDGIREMDAVLGLRAPTEAALAAPSRAG